MAADWEKDAKEQVARRRLTEGAAHEAIDGGEG